MLRRDIIVRPANRQTIVSAAPFACQLEPRLPISLKLTAACSAAHFHLSGSTQISQSPFLGRLV